MGSWNATCGLTNLAITYNTDVYVFTVTEVDTSYYRSHCENNCFYKPQLIPFIATYEDYGYCVNSNGISFKYRDWETDRKSTRLNSSHSAKSRMPSSA